MLNAIHFGHASRDSMLRNAADVWWPSINSEIVEKEQNYPQCSKAGENVKCLKSQKEYGKNLSPKIQMMRFQLISSDRLKLPKRIKSLLVSVDNNSGGPEALFSPHPTADEVFEVMAEYLAMHGMPRRVRTDPGTVFKSENSCPTI